MRTVTVLLLIAILLIPATFTAAQTGLSLEGGTGLLNMNSAKTIGSGKFALGVNWVGMRKDHPVLWGSTYLEPTDYPSVIGFPVTLGITDYLELSASPYIFHDARELKVRSRVFDYYGKSTTGSGVTRVAGKVRLPALMSERLFLAAKVGASLDTADDNLEGMNYRWVRDATDIDLSFLETWDITEMVNLNLEEGYVISGDDYFDNQVVLSAGVEFRPANRWALGLELNSRTFIENDPMRALQEGPVAYLYPPGQIGNPKELLDDELDWGDDYLLLTPSIRYAVSDHVTLSVGGLINLGSDQADPKETAQIYAGITINGALSFLLDSDGDGVKNNVDREPETPEGFPVDRFGISLDTDADGVPDGRDREINTPRGAKVNSWGVGQDSDGDGVLNGIDRQPDTRQGATVDKWGVALDADKDGVPDGIDREPATRQGALVDEWGVALDGDGDGVPDGIDLEPDTPRGKKVDQYGRAIIEEVKKLLDEGVITVHNIFFATGKTTLTADSYPVIRTVAEIFARYPTLRIRIEGHTDSSGSRALNMRLSKGRAQAVLDQIMKFRPDLDISRFVVEGIGPDKPIASNKTAAGRQQNRRVEFSVINREELKNLTQ